MVKAIFFSGKTRGSTQGATLRSLSSVAVCLFSRVQSKLPCICVLICTCFASEVLPVIKKYLVIYLYVSMLTDNRDLYISGGVAAYNSGVSTIKSWGGVDSATTGRDYSNDVIARAKWFKAHGWN
jgi:hypothetical protein